MYRKKIGFLMWCMLCLLFAWTSSLQAQSFLQYQDRGNRHEGIKPKPVSGYDIELLSVRVDYQEQASQPPAVFKVKFYLNQETNAYLTVRELEYKHYYWMDKVQPEHWEQGVHDFGWPTQEVIQSLKDLEMYDLGVVTRLEREEPSKAEKVAPVILYHSQVPDTIQGYLFTFKTNGDARLVCSIYKEGEEESVFIQNFPKKRGGRPFTVKWESSEASEGLYRLVVNGYFLTTNDPIHQIVSFYHRPTTR